MKPSVLSVFIAAALLVSAGLLQGQARQPQFKGPAAIQDGISVYFSPSGGCTEAIVAEIEKAQKSIKLQAYSFTSAPIAKAIVDANKRGVQVTAILGKSQRTEKYSSATFLQNQNVPVFIDAKHAIAHNKIILIDGKTIITGSFNFTKAAEENNAENLLIIRGKADLVGGYERNFQAHLDHAEKYEGRVGEAGSPTRGPPVAVSPDQNPGQEATVYITKSGKKYHAQGCSFLTASSTPVKLAEAKSRGFTACSKCNPPQ
jgi:phosphatidylserine/phosphatidylglycerophosphate/cardiolipin synthase-like enzyme